MLLPLPFSSKELPTGEKLFRRKYGYKVTILANQVTTFDITVPYPSQKVNEAQIVGCNSGVTVNFKVIDTEVGTYSTVPNFVLDQFGFNVVINEKFFEDISPYDAHLYAGMRIRFEFNNPGSEHEIGINMVFHEVRV